MAIDRSNAKKWTLAAQALLGVSVLGLGAAAFLNMPGNPIDQPPTAPELPNVNSNVASSSLAAIPRGDGVGTAARLIRVANTPKSAEVPAPTPTPVDVPTPPSMGPSISYLGCVRIGTAKRGLINLDAKQKFVTLRQTVGEGANAKEVEEIEDDYIVIGGKRYERPGRTGSVLSQATRNPRGAIQPLARAGGPPTKMSAVNRNQPSDPFGSGAPQQDLMLDGFLRVPEYVNRDDAALWRRIRAELLEEGKFDPNEVGRIAAKYIEERRDNMKEEDLVLTPEQREAERRFQEMYGDIERTKKGQGE